MNRGVMTFLSGSFAGAAFACLLILCSSRLPGSHRRSFPQADTQISNGQRGNPGEDLSNPPLNGNTVESQRLRVAGSPGRDISEPSTPPTGFSGADATQTNRIEAAMALSRQANRGLLVDGRLLQIRQRLQLTLEQQQQARELLERRFDDPRRSGDFNLEFPGILTQAQQQSWQQMQREDQQRRVEDAAWNWAVSELGRMRSSLGLTREQQEAAMPVLYQSGLEMGEAENRKESDAPNWPGRLQRDLEALKQVLSDEQFAIYQKYQQQMLQSNQMISEEGP